MADDGTALSDMRGRVAAAGGPANASAAFAKEWLAFNDAPEPAFIPSNPNRGRCGDTRYVRRETGIH